MLKRHQRDGSGFEGALSQVQAVTDRSAPRREAIEDLRVFQDALRETFTLMNSVLIRKTGIDFSNDRAASVRDFLARFDAIFSLNQDLLLEKHYVDTVNPGNPAVILPGIRKPPDLAPFEYDRWLREEWVVDEARPDNRINPDMQPLFKLHGSGNWRSATGNELIILGGRKSKAIRESPVLSWYHAEFERRLKEPGARLMTIGYGYQDPHINEPVYAVRDLPIFLVDPIGTKVGLRPQDRRTDGIPVANPLDDKNLIGISTRPLASTFGSDALERAKLMTFFEP